MVRSVGALKQLLWKIFTSMDGGVPMAVQLESLSHSLSQPTSATSLKPQGLVPLGQNCMQLTVRRDWTLRKRHNGSACPTL